MPLPQEKRFTYADVLAWDERERYELILGEPVMMAPPSRAHQRISGRLYLQFGSYLKDKKCEVYHAPFGVRLFEQANDYPDDVDTMVEPDIVIVCDPNKLDDAGCKGAPDLIIEILSPSSARYDRVVKFNLYQRAGVQEYWIVDPDNRTVQVHTLEDGQYHSPIAYNENASIEVGILDNCIINLKDVFS